MRRWRAAKPPGTKEATGANCCVACVWWAVVHGWQGVGCAHHRMEPGERVRSGGEGAAGALVRCSAVAVARSAVRWRWRGAVRCGGRSGRCSVGDYDMGLWYLNPS